MALYAFDGTGNEDRDGDDRDSNVLDFFRAYIDPLKNDDPKKERGSLYLKGIGTRAGTLIGDKVAEAFGLGGHKRVRQAMDRLEHNFEAGDQTIDVIGFSRGAALAISFANEVASKLSKLSIRFIGVFDIVGEFGLPGEHFNAGHHLSMPANAEHCYHAMALDETRLLFQLTRLGTAVKNERLQEVWFRGVHSDVGGGNGNRGLNWIALNWLYSAALRAGLPIAPEAVVANLVDKDLAQAISDHKVDAQHQRRILASDLLHKSVRLDVGGGPGRPLNNPEVVLARVDDDGNIFKTV